MTKEDLQSLPDNTIVTRTSKSGKTTEWIKSRNGREPHWAWFWRLFKDGKVSPVEGILNANEIEVKR